METDSPMRGLRVLGRPSMQCYFRAAQRDRTLMATLISEGWTIGTGIILGPDARDHDLIDVARQAGHELILDTYAVELSLPGGIHQSAVRKLPWATDEIQTPETFRRPSDQREFCESIAESVIECGMSSVLAPTHYLEHIPGPWLTTDVQNAIQLRASLDANGAEDVPLYYPLIAPLRVLAEWDPRKRILKELSTLVARGVIDAVWLRIPNFGTTNSGPVLLRRYIKVARSFHRLGIPLVAERTGTVGLALLAVGAVGGIESGVTLGERYDISDLRAPRPGNKGGRMPGRRVYFPELGGCLDVAPSKELLAKRGLKNRLICQRVCCPRGVADMVEDRGRHYLVTRAREVADFSMIPSRMLNDHFLSTWLATAVAMAGQGAKANARIEKYRKRAEHWTQTLSAIKDDDDFRAPTRSTIPSGTRIGLRGA